MRSSRWVCGSAARRGSTAAATASASASLQVTSVAAESAPCSASVRRSSASSTGSAESSARIRLSLGPCSMFVATPCSAASSCATVTAGLPGPTTLRTRGIEERAEHRRGDAARAVDAPDLAQAELRGDVEIGRIDAARRAQRRAQHDDLRHARDRRRDAEVRHDRRERALAARHVDRGRGDRAGALAHDHARARSPRASPHRAARARCRPRRARDHAVERVAQLGRELRAGAVQLGVGHAQVAGCRIDAVEALQRGAQRPVARRRDVLVERAHRGPQLGVEDAGRASGA